jgi:molybdopterin converting factor small subunit
MPEIRIPPVLRAEAAGQRLVDVEAATVREALGALVDRYPALGPRVDGDDVRLLSGLDTPTGPTSKILLLPAVAGG